MIDALNESKTHQFQLGIGITTDMLCPMNSFIHPLRFLNIPKKHFELQWHQLVQVFLR